MYAAFKISLNENTIVEWKSDRKIECNREKENRLHRLLFTRKITLEHISFVEMFQKGPKLL